MEQGEFPPFLAELLPGRRRTFDGYRRLSFCDVVGWGRWTRPKARAFERESRVPERDVPKFLVGGDYLGLFLAPAESIA